MPPQSLRKVLTISQAVGLALTIVVGSGLFVLPGLAYQEAGGAAIYAWLLCLGLAIPLLIIFAQLGARWPGAGGIAGFLQQAFSRRFAAASEILLIGTFGLGIPAIALTGGYYAAALFHNDALATPIALILLLIAGAVNWRGAEVSGNIQRGLAFVLCGVLFVVAALALGFGERSAGAAFTAPLEMESWRTALPVAGLVFFAFTGWEMLSFTAEEYRNPRRDFPLAVAFSFIIVAALYLLVAAAVQLTLPQHDPQTAAAPLAALLNNVVGAAGGVFVSAVAVVIILANLIGAVWAASRLVFASAREGLLPRLAAELDTRQTPRMAVALAVGVFAVVLGVHAFGGLELDDMLRLAGQNFFLLYALSVAAYLKTARTPAAYALGGGSLLVSVAMMGVFGPEMLYPLVLLGIGYLAHAYRTDRAGVSK